MIEVARIVRQLERAARDGRGPALYVSEGRNTRPNIFPHRPWCGLVAPHRSGSGWRAPLCTTSLATLQSARSKPGLSQPLPQVCHSPTAGRFKPRGSGRARRRARQSRPSPSRRPARRRRHAYKRSAEVGRQQHACHHDVTVCSRRGSNAFRMVSVLRPAAWHLAARRSAATHTATLTKARKTPAVK